MKKAIIERWMLYFGGSVMALVLFCMVVCQPETVEMEAKDSSALQDRSTWQRLLTKDTKPDEIERLKTPDELYAERHTQNNDKDTTSFSGDEVVPPELLQLEQETIYSDQAYVEQDHNIVPFELQELEQNSSDKSYNVIKLDQNILPVRLQKVEKKSLKGQQDHIMKQDNKIVSKKLQRLEQRQVSKIKKQNDSSTVSDIIPEELRILEK